MFKEYAKRGRNLYISWTASESSDKTANTTYDDLTSILGHESNPKLMGRRVNA